MEKGENPAVDALSAAFEGWLEVNPAYQQGDESTRNAFAYIFMSGYQAGLMCGVNACGILSQEGRKSVRYFPLNETIKKCQSAICAFFPAFDEPENVPEKAEPEEESLIVLPD